MWMMVATRVSIEVGGGRWRGHVAQHGLQLLHSHELRLPPTDSRQLTIGNERRGLMPVGMQLHSSGRGISLCA